MTSKDSDDISSKKNAKGRISVEGQLIDPVASAKGRPRYKGLGAEAPTPPILEECLKFLRTPCKF